MIFSHITDQPGEVASIAMQLAYQSDALHCFEALTAQSDCALLLESAEIDSKDNLKSLLLIDAALRIECNDQLVAIKALSANGATLLPYLAAKLQADAAVTLSAETLDVTFSRPAL
ncbi:MAG TPA: anthranilate synthase component I, partial [Rheinheimera sp.]|nr:anthranilate synthase component I [Rheinheimera sp.]